MADDDYDFRAFKHQSARVAGVLVGLQNADASNFRRVIYLYAE
jgi:hypothetical protein